VDINQNQIEYILEYIKGLKVKISPIIEQGQKSKFGNYLETRKFKSNKKIKIPA